MSALINEHDSDSDSDSSGPLEPNWDLLGESLSPTALQALKEQMAKPAAAALSSTSTTTSTQITPSPSTSSTSNAPDKLGGSLPLPKTNKAYGEHQYWEARFAEEEEVSVCKESVRKGATQFVKELNSP